ncbi:MAG: hflB [Devosia sp.]|uniref:AAA family ATPase n=1 Tax=Devosia sp. TaxID=1871048 RepID=UPI0026196355|nr:AAA family ATPase [Devosia sp.]MDB5531490.1 hflB [Devosia sp.]
MTFKPIDLNDADDDEDDSYLEEVTPRGDLTGLNAAADALPIIMLRQAMSTTERTAFRHNHGITVVIKAPGAEWATPLLDAGKELAHWGFSLTATASDRKSKDTITRDQVMRALAKGGRVLAVSQNPVAFLPEGLAGSADMTINVSPPDDVVLKRTIFAATGRYPRRMPSGISRGLSYAQICFAIRKGSTPRECVARLLAARLASQEHDPDLAKVPALDSLHGYGEAMEWAKRLIADLDAWRRGELEFSAIERTAVLASEPGLGKTTFVRSLAKAAGVPLVVTSVSGWFATGTGHLDSVIKQIDLVFSSAAAKGPAIVFLDEIEGIPNRATMSERNADYWTPVVGHILLTLDSAGSGVSSNLIVIGATNHPEKLDAALLRPGRLSKVIRIKRPDKQALAGIMRQHLGNDLADEDLSDIAAFGQGASGADVTEWVKVARSVARQAGRTIELDDLLAQVAPTEDRPPEIDHRIAVHEAGHAVVMQVLGLLEVSSVSTISSGVAGGSVTVAAPSRMLSKADMDSYVTFVLAGRSAEEIVLGSVSSGSGGSRHSDLATATQMVASAHLSLGMGGSLLYRGEPEDFRSLLSLDYHVVPKIEADLQRLYANATDIVVEYREAVKAVAKALLRERFLSGERFREIFDRHPPGSKTIELDGRDG